MVIALFIVLCALSSFVVYDRMERQHSDADHARHISAIVSSLAEVLRHVTPKPVEPLRESEITAAIRSACAECGVNVSALHDEFDLVKTGKLGDILHHATDHLGHPIHTVRDLHAWLRESED